MDSILRERSLGLGCWALGGDSYGAVSESESESLLKKAYEYGVRFFDTSPAYGDGQSELRIGRYLSNKPDLEIATKVGMLFHEGHQVPYDFSKQALIDSVNKSLTRLKRDQIDLLQLHSPVIGFQHEFEDVFETLIFLKESGKVRNVGISLRSPSYLKQQLDLFDWNSFQFNLSLIDQRIRGVFQEVKIRDCRLIARTPLNFGFLTENPPNIENLGEKSHLSGWSRKQLEQWQVNSNKVRELCLSYGISLLAASLRFPIDSGLANMVIPGARNSEELEKNVQAFNKLELSSDITNELIKLYDSEFNRKVESPYQYVKTSIHAKKLNQ